MITAIAIALAITVVYMGYLLHQTVMRAENAEHELFVSREAYRSLERGADEQQEAYEQEYLTWHERQMAAYNTIDELKVDVMTLQADNYRLEARALPDLAEMRFWAFMEGVQGASS